MGTNLILIGIGIVCLMIVAMRWAGMNVPSWYKELTAGSFLIGCLLAFVGMCVSMYQFFTS